MKEQTTTEISRPNKAEDSLAQLHQVAHEDASAEGICAELARLFQVKPDEVALLRVENAMLKFLFPPGLKTAGAVPLTGPAVAARTATTKSTLLSNNFAKIKHVRIFEDAKSGIPSETPERLPIQKLMSVPVLDNSRRVLGVVQISRKGFDLASAGPDFSTEGLKLLEQAAAVIAGMKFMQ